MRAMLHPLIIFIAAILTHNIALTYLLGMCPLVAMSRNLNTAAGMGLAVIFVMVITAPINWFLYRMILIPTGSKIISYLIFIIVIASTVQLLEMLIERFFPRLQSSLGIFLPLITVNCTILAVSLFMYLRDYNIWQTIFFALGSGIGWTLAISMIAAIREKLRLVGDIPEGLKGAGITMVIAGILALAFIGFSGMVSVQ
ncbi:TPA: NADH:ubiquinone reductase (Na(+)-transporting) subunit E [Candidatus Poribacteria bacterium]|nr:NADH:ubiquinone reductase (Na(+)-transporting) subunit E [Candidatus Poribacteria bacterium]